MAKKNLLLLPLVTSIIILTPFNSRAEEPAYKLAEKLAMQAVDHTKIELPKLSQAEKTVLEKNVHKIKPVLVPLTDFEKKEICFDLFSKNIEAQDISSIASSEAIQELHILCGDTGSVKSNLLNKFKPTTTAGFVVLARNLMQPISDVKEITKKQTIIKEMVNNPELLAALETELQLIKESESPFFGFWKDEDDLNAKALKEVYFPEKLGHFNNSPVALEALRTFQTLWQSLGFLSPMTLSNMMSYLSERATKDLLLNGKTGKEVAWDALYNVPKSLPWAIKAEFTGHSLAPTPGLQNTPDYQMATSHKAAAYITVIKPSYTLRDKYNALTQTGVSPTTAIATLALYRLGIDAWWLYRAFQASNVLRFQYNVSNHLHTKMNGVAAVISSCKNINKLVSNSSVLLENLGCYRQLQKLCYDPAQLSASTREFMNIISQDTFKGKPTAFSLRGRVLAAANLMPKVKNDFIPALEAIGELDACVTIAKNMLALESEAIHYCFAEFVDSETPYIEIENGWNPLVNPKNAVPFTIAMGINTAVPNGMLTGPHGCGKSTTMETLAYNVLFAHRWGVGFASSLKLSPFTKMRTYMDIKQNREEGLSTFMAEAHRVDQIEHELSMLKPGERCFTVMDEVFKGTMEKEGAKRLYKFGKKVVEIPQNICIFATHFALPTTLEEESNGKIINFHVGLEEPVPGQFIPTYQVVKGVNTWWFDDKEKRERYIDWLRERIKIEYAQAA